MMKMTTRQILQRQAVEGAVLVMAMTMMAARVRSTWWVVRMGPGKGRVQGMAKGKGRGRQPRKGRGRETVMGKILLNKPHEEMISGVLFL
jgi:hypothetical protein